MANVEQNKKADGNLTISCYIFSYGKFCSLFLMQVPTFFNEMLDKFSLFTLFFLTYQ